ncbi:hypothetical protein BC629DRAFT_1591787 [Irpex lacteus]|nr:hypothetical protein BC629DRAFT_1591787 [Irpex lacteus]
MVQQWQPGTRGWLPSRTHRLNGRIVPSPGSFPTSDDRTSSYFYSQFTNTPRPPAIFVLFCDSQHFLGEFHAPLVDTFTESAAYLDLLSRQPPHPSEGPAVTELSLHGDPITDRERRRHWERKVRRRLHTLKWARRVFRAIISGWALYNATRYFLAFTIYTSPDRQVTSLVLGSVAVLALMLALTSQVLGLFAPHFGWNYSAASFYTRLQIFLNYATSVLLLVHSRALPLGIDVVWSGVGFQCGGGSAVKWGYWLAGALVRYVSLHLIRICYNKTTLAKRISRSRSISSTGHTPAPPQFPEFRTMTSMTTTPVSLPVTRDYRTLALLLVATSRTQTLFTLQTIPRGFDGPSHELPATASFLAMAAQDKPVYPFPLVLPIFSRPFIPRRTYTRIPTSSEEDYPDAVETDAYGRPIHRHSGTYTYSTSLSLTPQAESPNPLLQEEVHTFGDHFDSLMAQLSRETEEGLRYAQNDHSSYYTDTSDSTSMTQTYEPFPTDEYDTDYVP